MDQASTFHIKQQHFEGPIEVLLELIEKRKLFVNDVSLATVTDDFISYIQSVGMHPEMVAGFLSVAATLILIKARSLLPNIELTPEETESIGDLERRVALYKLVSDISGTLIKEYGKKVSFEGIVRSSGPVFAPSPTLTVDSLAALLVGVITRVPKSLPTAPVARVYKTISISEVLGTLTDRIERAMNTLKFSDIAVSSPDADEKSQKVYTIVSFLGMLELVRRGFIEAEQTELFEDISIGKTKQDISIDIKSAEESFE